MGNPLRILHVVVNMNRGGAETLIMNLYRNIDRSKVQFDFLTSKTGSFDMEIQALGGKIHRIPYISDVGHFKYLKELNRFFGSHGEYKIVHSHMDKMSGLVLRAARKVGIPIRISHSHNTSSEGSFAAKVYKWYAGIFILRNATNLFACSTKAAKWLFNEDSDSIKLVKNGIEVNEFSFNPRKREKIQKELNLNKDQIVLGHVGRFAPQKNHAYLIELFAKLQENNKNFVLILVGDGPLRSEIERKVRELKLVEKVKFLGIRDDIQDLLQAFDLFIFPSLHEGLPVSLIEAQGAGLPCLISNEISREVDLGCNLVKFISLHDKTKWIEEIKNVKINSINRGTVTKTMVRQGYDIRETAEEIKNFYLRISG